MKPLRLQSERFRPEGGIDARAQQRALGIPTNVDFSELFLRETLQNSWDAKAGRDPVRFSIDARVLATGQREVLRDVVFRHTPPLSGPGAFLNIEQLEVLVVTDSGTRGLNGPTRADTSFNPDEANFVDLVRNTGRDESKGYAAGTYGFGKAVLWKASICRTVLMYSRTTHSGVPVTRMVATALGVAYDHKGARYTGRHWWGAEGTGTVDPLEGRAADELAAALGMDDRLPAGMTGTSLMIIAPAFEDASLDDVVARFAETATAYAWPHMVSTSTRKPDIEFAFTCNGRTVEPLDPAVDPRMRHYVDAYRRCEDLLAGHPKPETSWPWTVDEVRSQRPDRLLGVIAHRDYSYIPDGGHDVPPADIALMRGPRLVVRYIPVKAAPTGQGTVGVFIASPDLDEKFASAEPATHDDWSPSNVGLPRNQRNPVRQALEQIKNRFRRHLASVRPPEADYHAGTVTISSHLGRILDGAVTGTDTRIAAFPSTGPSRGNITTGAATDNPAATTGPAAGGAGGADSDGYDPVSKAGDNTDPTAGSRRTRPTRSRRQPRAVLEPTVQMVLVGGAPAVEFTAEVVVPDGSPGATVMAEPYVLVDGGRETEPPTGAGVPRVLNWREDDTHVLHTGSSVRLTRPGTTRWQVTVTQPRDTAISMRLDVQEVGA